MIKGISLSRSLLFIFLAIITLSLYSLQALAMVNVSKLSTLLSTQSFSYVNQDNKLSAINTNQLFNPLQPILTLGAIQANAQGSGVAGSQTGPGFTDCFPSSSGGNSIFNCLRAVFTFLLIVAIFLAALRIALLALGAINPLEVGNGLSNVKEEVTKLVTGVVLLSSFTIIINTVNPAALQIDFLSSLGQIVTRGSSGNLNTPPEINIGTNIGQVVANNNTTPAVNNTTPAVNQPVSTTGWAIPTKGILSSPFGPRNGRLHAGIDIADDPRTPIYAARDGIVDYSGDLGCPDNGNGCNGGAGNMIILKHENGLITRYLHLTPGSLRVKEGESVKAGQHIAGMGDSGSSFGFHLHFEVRLGGSPTDPCSFFQTQCSASRF